MWRRVSCEQQLDTGYDPFYFFCVCQAVVKPCCRGVSTQGVGSARCRALRRGCGLLFLSCEWYSLCSERLLRLCVLRLTRLGHGSRHSTGVKVISSIASDLTCFYHHFEHGSGAFVLTCRLCLGYGLTGACDWHGHGRCGSTAERRDNVENSAT